MPIDHALEASEHAIDAFLLLVPTDDIDPESMRTDVLRAIGHALLAIHHDLAGRTPAPVLV